MSENPVPYNTDKSKRPSYIAIAKFLNGYLHRELLMDITGFRMIPGCKQKRA